MLTALVALGLAGCSSVDERADAAAAAAQRLAQAVEAGDGAAACAVLAPETAAELAESGDKPCAQAILDEELPGPAAVTDAEVYGQRALVRSASDTVFLAVFPDGWRVVAAGCAPRENRPYDCVVQGG